MAAYGKDDFVFSGFDDYDFSDFSDFSDQESNVSDETSETDDEVACQCVCGGVMTKDMIGCDAEKCPIEWWHFECAGIAKDAVPDGDWLCPRCRSASPAGPNVAGLSSMREPSTDLVSTGKTKSKADNKSADEKKTKGKTKPREKAPERPKEVFTKADAARCATSFFVTSLEQMKENPLFNCGSAPSLGIMWVVTQLLLLTGREEFIGFCNLTVSALWLILTSNEKKVLKPELYEGMWRSFHIYRTDSDAWEKFLKSLNISSKSDHSSKLAYQYLIQSVFGMLMKERNNTDLQDKEPLSSTSGEIDKEEEKVLRYVAGYIPFALMKKYKRQNSNTAQIYLRYLECWSVQSITCGKTFLTYTKEWIDAQNRGRLFQISDDVYLFFRSMELVSRAFLTISNLQKMSEVNINSVLMNNISSNYRVQTYWCALTDSKISGALSKNFLEVIIKFYIKLRCKAFLKVYLDIRKANSRTAISKKGEKALRKDL